jgi:hypothetical protein
MGFGSVFSNITLTNSGPPDHGETAQFTDILNRLYQRFENPMGARDSGHSLGVMKTPIVL